MFAGFETTYSIRYMFGTKLHKSHACCNPSVVALLSESELIEVRCSHLKIKLRRYLCSCASLFYILSSILLIEIILNLSEEFYCIRVSGQYLHNDRLIISRMCQAEAACDLTMSDEILILKAAPTWSMIRGQNVSTQWYTHDRAHYNRVKKNSHLIISSNFNNSQCILIKMATTAKNIHLM